MPNFKRNNLSIYLLFPLFIARFISILLQSMLKLKVLFIYSFLLKEKISFHILVGKFRKIISSLCYYFEILSEFVTISINIEQKNIGYNKLNRNIRLSSNISNWISLRINMGNEKNWKILNNCKVICIRMNPMSLWYNWYKERNSKATYLFLLNEQNLLPIIFKEQFSNHLSLTTTNTNYLINNSFQF